MSIIIMERVDHPDGRVEVLCNDGRRYDIIPHEKYETLCLVLVFERCTNTTHCRECAGGWSYQLTMQGSLHNNPSPADVISEALEELYIARTRGKA